MINFLYKIGLFKNELCDHIMENDYICEQFLNDVSLLEKGYHPVDVKVKTPTDMPKHVKNFEKSIDALVKALERKI